MTPCWHNYKLQHFILCSSELRLLPLQPWLHTLQIMNLHARLLVLAVTCHQCKTYVGMVRASIAITSSYSIGSSRASAWEGNLISGN